MDGAYAPVMADEPAAGSGKLRLGGMALANGLLLHGPHAWSIAVRDTSGSVRVATGRKNSLQIEIYGDKGSLLFDLENLNELGFVDATAPVREQGFRRILVNEPGHPYLEAWWPQGHIIGWEHTFTHQIRDFLTAIQDQTPPSPSFEEGLNVQYILNAVEESAAAKSALIQLPGTSPETSPTEGA